MFWHDGKDLESFLKYLPSLRFMFIPVRQPDGTPVNFFQDDSTSFNVGDGEVFEALEMAVMGMSVGGCVQQS
jgi:FKBP-type peptidyl-prolyl cis-trans isomerase 2